MRGGGGAGDVSLLPPGEGMVSPEAPGSFPFNSFGNTRPSRLSLISLSVMRFSRREKPVNRAWSQMTLISRGTPPEKR